MKISYKLAKALKYIFDLELVHRDFNPSNIMLDDQMNP